MVGSTKEKVMEIIKCPNCGGEVLSTADTCFRCGCKLPKNVEQTKPTQPSFSSYNTQYGAQPTPQKVENLTTPTDDIDESLDQEKDFETATHVDDIEVKLSTGGKLLNSLCKIVWFAFAVLLFCRFLSCVGDFDLYVSPIYLIVTFATGLLLIFIAPGDKESQKEAKLDKLSNIAVNVNLDDEFFKDKKIVMVIDEVVHDDTFYAVGTIKDCPIKNGDSISIYSEEGIVENNATAHGVIASIEIDGKPDTRENEVLPGESASIGLRTDVIVRKGMVLIKNENF